MLLIVFNYEGSVEHLSKAERKNLEADLIEGVPRYSWDYFDLSRKELSIGGRYDYDDGYCADWCALESILDKYEIDWTGKSRYVDEDRDIDCEC